MSSLSATMVHWQMHILDRIVHDAYKINIESMDPSRDISMRELYGIDQKLSE